MKTAVVTGASSGIGKEITLRLLNLGYRVIGLARAINQEEFKNEHFTSIDVDLSNEKEILNVCEKLKGEQVFILIHCAGLGRFEPHEELSAKTILEMISVNLTAPLLLTNALLRTLKKNDGYLIQINSIEALRAAKFAGVYSATKAGLKAFGDSLFEETRKSGLSVTNINPDMTQSPFYDQLRFTTSIKEDERLVCSDIADALEHILTMRKGAVISEYTIRSLHFGIKKNN